VIVDWWRCQRCPEDREDVISKDGTVVFNYLQQREVDTTEKSLTPLEEAGTTDPWGVTDEP
jgi:hypothetical protein